MEKKKKRKKERKEKKKRKLREGVVWFREQCTRKCKEKVPFVNRTRVNVDIKLYIVSTL